MPKHVATPIEQNEPANALGVAVHTLIPGGFYVCKQIGGITDVLTGINIPGPKAEMHQVRKKDVVKLVDMPDPVQLPHFKLMLEFDETDKTPQEVEKKFNAADKTPVHTFFADALAAGVIVRIPDEMMQRMFPRAWAARETKLVWVDPALIQIKSRTIDDLFNDLLNEHKETETLQETVAEAKTAVTTRATQIQGASLPPPPPPAP